MLKKRKKIIRKKIKVGDTLLIDQWPHFPNVMCVVYEIVKPKYGWMNKHILLRSLDGQDIGWKVSGLYKGQDQNAYEGVTYGTNFKDISGLKAAYDTTGKKLYSKRLIKQKRGFEKIILWLREFNYVYWVLPLMVLGFAIYAGLGNKIGLFMVIVMGLVVPLVELYPNIKNYITKKR